MCQRLVVRHAEGLRDGAHFIHHLRLQAVIVLHLTPHSTTHCHQPLVDDAVVGPTGIDRSTERVQDIHGVVLRQCLAAEEERRRREIVGECGIGNGEHGTVVKPNGAFVALLAVRESGDRHGMDARCEIVIFDGHVVQHLRGLHQVQESFCVEVERLSGDEGGGLDVRVKNGGYRNDDHFGAVDERGERGSEVEREGR